MTLGPVMVDLAGVAIEPVERELLRHPQVGSVILFARNYESPAQLGRLTAEIHAVRTPPLLIAVDQEGGRVQRSATASRGFHPCARSAGVTLRAGATALRSRVSSAGSWLPSSARAASTCPSRPASTSTTGSAR